MLLVGKGRMPECVDARVRRCLMLGLRRLTGRERERAASRYSSVPADAARRVFGFEYLNAGCESCDEPMNIVRQARLPTLRLRVQTPSSSNADNQKLKSSRAWYHNAVL